MKENQEIVGKNEDIVIKRGQKKKDWEVEIGIIIGKKEKYVREEEEIDYVEG